MGCVVIVELRACTRFTRISMLSSNTRGPIMPETSGDARPLQCTRSLFFTAVLWVAVGDNHDSSVSSYKCWGQTARTRWAPANDNTLLILAAGSAAKPDTRGMLFVHNADIARAQHAPCAVHVHILKMTVHSYIVLAVHLHLPLPLCSHLQAPELTATVSTQSNHLPQTPAEPQRSSPSWPINREHPLQ